MAAFISFYKKGNHQPIWGTVVGAQILNLQLHHHQVAPARRSFPGCYGCKSAAVGLDSKAASVTAANEKKQLGMN